MLRAFKAILRSWGITIDLFEGVWSPIYQSSLPVCVRFPWRFLRGQTDFPIAQTLRPINFRTHLKRFGIKIDLSLGCGAHVLSRLLFSSSGSALGAPDTKSLPDRGSSCVHISETIIYTYSKLKLCIRFAIFCFSLWVCNAFKTFSKSTSEIESVARKCYTLHTVSATLPLQFKPGSLENRTLTVI